MMLLPIKADLALSRIPFITVLICLVCCAVFYAQQKNWEDVISESKEFCQQGHGRIFDMVLKNVYGAYGEEGCMEFVVTASLDKQPEVVISNAVNGMSQFTNMSAADSRKLASKRLQDKYQVYQASVSADLTTELAYDPKHYSLYSMFTATIAHSGWGHILGNLIIFFAFAASVEIALGYARFLAAYAVLAITTAVSYSVAMSVVESPLPTIGLSGVVMGMIGLFMYLIPFGNIRCFFWLLFIFRMVTVPAWILAVWYVGWDVYSLFSAENQSNVNLVAHVSGACFGYLFGFLFCRNIKQRIATELKKNRQTRRRQSARVAGLRG